MNKIFFKSSLDAKRTIIFSLLFALPIVFLSQVKLDERPLRADPVLASRTFTKESVDTPTVYPESGFLLCDGTAPEEHFRFFYYSAATQDLNNHFVTLQADPITHYDGTLMNMSVFNGLATITVTFSGEGILYAGVGYVLNELDFDYELTSGVEIDVNPTFDEYGYVMIFTDSETPIHIDSIEIGYTCTNEVDQYFYADENNELGYARSAYGSLFQEHDQFLLSTNPTETTNNYSLGETAGHPNKWYRWNGLAVKNYRLDGEVLNWGATPYGSMVSDHFCIQTTAMIDPAIFYDPDALFHLAPWVEIGDANHTSLGWIQSYIGSDNYDPIGGINTDRTDTYRERFYTNYVWDPDYYSEGNGEWAFQDPNTNIEGTSLSLKGAYELNDLPFFTISFIIEGNSFKLRINGFLIFSDDNYFYDTYTNQQYTIQQIHLQAVNYGHQGDSEAIPPIEQGEPLDPYFYGYTNPMIYNLQIPI